MKKVSLLLLMLVAAGLILSACGNKNVPTPEDKIRKYIYENQPVEETEFIRWADKELDEYSNRQIYRALYNEGKYQAELGHPTATAVLGSLAKAWAKRKGLPYKETDWRNLHETAISNLKETPNQLELWPSQ